MFDMAVAFLLAVLFVVLLLDAITIQLPWEDRSESVLRRGLREFGEWMRK